jgi:hypothetical protein
MDVQPLYVFSPVLPVVLSAWLLLWLVAWVAEGN